MSLNSFDNLKLSIANFLARKDLDALVPDFITLAESRLNNNPDFRVRQMVCKLIAEISGTEIGLPIDYLGMRVFRQASGEDIRQVSPTVLQQNKLNHCEGHVYCDLGQRLEIWPEADQEDMALYYYQKLPALSDANQANWLLALAPDVYLYGSLVSASSYMKNDDRVGLWQTLYTDAVNGVINSDANDRWSSGSMVVSL